MNEHKQKKQSVKCYKVIFERVGCIGAAACVAIAPQFWEIISDGKANLKGAKHIKNNDVQELELSQEDLAIMKEAAEACPVTVIHIEDKETGEKII